MQHSLHCRNICTHCFLSRTLPPPARFCHVNRRCLAGSTPSSARNIHVRQRVCQRRARAYHGTHRTCAARWPARCPRLLLQSVPLSPGHSNSADKRMSWNIRVTRKHFVPSFFFSFKILTPACSIQKRGGRLQHTPQGCQANCRRCIARPVSTGCVCVFNVRACIIRAFVKKRSPRESALISRAAIARDLTHMTWFHCRTS